MDIRFEHTFVVRYRGLRLIPSRTAARELLAHGLSAHDCRDVLEEGYAPRKRRSGTIERWLDVGEKTYNVVVVRVYNHAYREEIWLITHTGIFGRKKWLRKS